MLVVAIIGWILVVLGIILKVKKKMKWSPAVFTVLVGLIAGLIGTTHLGGGSTAKTATTTSSAPVISHTGPVPEYEIIDANIMYGAYTQLVSDSETGNPQQIQQDLPSAQKNLQAAQADVTKAKSSGQTIDPTFSDFIARYTKFVNDMAAAVKDGEAGNSKAQQNDVSQATAQTNAMNAEFAAITNANSGSNNSTSNS